jgi:hypothetical protein
MVVQNKVFYIGFETEIIHVPLAVFAVFLHDGIVVSACPLREDILGERVVMQHGADRQRGDFIGAFSQYLPHL